ncbi:hypothetical protein LSH36_926g00025 [Paralvinella palmiformis]|uniref:Uncharacterized protein n=1 Tax=Paralvinella palmiformis TaxID=53620 RepID=A0AAD9MSY0_9ANNE|nr:hypothetical protein LSH36_926g00025 [Paralvinella palmiformis]
MERLTCTGQHLFYLQDSILRLNRTVLGGKKLTHCIYRAIDRISDSYHVYSNPLKRKNNFEIRVKNDFFCVECYTNESKRYEEFMMYESLQDNQRRRLLQLNDRDSVQYRLQHSINQNEVFKAEHRASMISDQVHHSPKLYGSMGLPDLPDSMLHHQEKRVKDSDVNGKEFKLRSAMLKEHRLQDEPSQRAAVPERKRNILGLQPARVEQVQQLMQQQVQQQQQPLQQEWQQQLQQKPHLQQEVKQQANNELQQNRISAQQQRFVSQRNISHGKQEQNIKEVNGLAQQTKNFCKTRLRLI